MHAMHKHQMMYNASPTVIKSASLQ